MNGSRRLWLVFLAAGWLAPSAFIAAALAQDSERRVIELRIEHRRLDVPGGAIRITEGEVVELRWTSDESVELHLHGYNIETQVRPGTPSTTIIKAYATGRFPITSHGWGEGGHSHDTLTYLDVYPR